jgi:hypothetical protein
MIRRLISILALTVTAVFSQEAGSVKAALQHLLGEVKSSMARNQAQLRQYAWTETTDVSYKGINKKRTQNECIYGPDGKIQKTPIGEPAPPTNARGIRGKIVANKTDELKDYMDRVGSLVKRYVPLDPQLMEASLQAGKATLNPGSGELVFTDYVKPGDKLTVTFDAATQQLNSFAVVTYLNEPKDTVTLDASFSRLPDGTSFLDQSVLAATAKQIQVTTVNSEYRKTGG